ncbi:hypothetical protein SEPCBS119000_005703 [Sporothrix epigloea]|uniref:Uncharacterized protein n=1 Tax=Sporothrix epigloea TaxID=1892477 RepID=A0ABP0E2I8_9PEZI
MFFASLVAAIALAVIQRACAAPILDVCGRNDPHELDIRTFGVEGCQDENQGVYTLELSQSNVCYTFVDPIGSLTVADNLCTLTIYDDDACTEAPVVVPTNICQNGTWKSYKMTC